MPVVFAVGRLVKKKGFEYLIDAAAALKAQQPQVRVAIAGSGDLEASLRARAHAAGVGDACSSSATFRTTSCLLLAAADVAVAPSVHEMRKRRRSSEHGDGNDGLGHTARGYAGRRYRRGGHRWGDGAPRAGTRRRALAAAIDGCCAIVRPQC